MLQRERSQPISSDFKLTLIFLVFFQFTVLGFASDLKGEEKGTPPSKVSTKSSITHTSDDSSYQSSLKKDIKPGQGKRLLAEHVPTQMANKNVNFKRDKGGFKKSMHSQISQNSKIDTLSENRDAYIMASLPLLDATNLRWNSPFSAPKPDQSSANHVRQANKVSEVINGHNSEIQDYYHKVLKLKPSLKGKMAVRIFVDASGSVSEVQVVNSSIRDIDFETMIIKCISQWDDFGACDNKVGEKVYIQEYVFGE